jgi:hypothetical protein
MKFVLAAFVLCSNAAFAGVVSDSNLGYSITLPSNWSQLKSKPAQHYFRDSTRAYKGQISILKYEIDKSSYPTPESWTQAQFIAYKLSIETSSYPFGAVAFYDSTAKAVLGKYWAPEAFSVLYPADGDPTYCEFIRYCAVENVGYEIYAIGDSTDMMKNVDFYASIIATVAFTAPVLSIAPRSEGGIPSRLAAGVPEVDLLGRSMPEFRGFGGKKRSAQRVYRLYHVYQP